MLKYLNLAKSIAKKCFPRRVIFLSLFSITITLFLLPFLHQAMQAFAFDSDEGRELMKALLYSKGHPLYQQIFSDQPPLFTFILSFFIKLFGPSVYYSRLIVLGFSAILLYSLYQIVKIESRGAFSFLSVLFLAFSAGYLRLSVSVMQAIPSLSLALFSLYLLYLYKEHKKKRLLLFSGIIFSLSIQIKLSAFLFIPLIILKTCEGRNKKPLFLWAGGFLVSCMAIILYFFHFKNIFLIKQLFAGHLKYEFFSPALLPYANFSLLCRIALKDYGLLVLAAFSAFFLLKRKKKEIIPPLIWLGTVLPVLIIWKPIWYHYYLLISIPVAWVASLGINMFIQDKNKLLRGTLIFLMGLSILRLPFKYKEALLSVKRSVSFSCVNKITKLLLKYKPYTRWVIADRPMFAFRAGMLTVPELTIISAKRNFLTKNEIKYFREQLEKYKPEIIIISSSSYYSPSLLSFIKDKYTNIYTAETFLKKLPSPQRQKHLFFPDYVWVAGIKGFAPHPATDYYAPVSILKRNIFKKQIHYFYCPSAKMYLRRNIKNLFSSK